MFADEAIQWGIQNPLHPVNPINAGLLQDLSLWFIRSKHGEFTCAELLGTDAGSRYTSSVPIISVIRFTRFSKHQRCSPSTIFSVAQGSQKFAVPTSTAAAPASMNSITSSAVVMPPMPMTGISTVCAASYTMRRAIGLIAGPLKPAVMLEMRGLRVLASMAMPTKVFTSETASAPAFSADLAMAAMLVTLGESFTISGLLA